MGLSFAVLIVCLLAAQDGSAGPPPNDNFADRIPLADTRVTVTGSNAGATREPGEPPGVTSPNGPASLKTVWWTWTAPADGGLAVSVKGSDFLAAVHVYTGSSVSNLAWLSGNAWAPYDQPPYTTEVRVTAGTAYQIAVGSLSGVSGKIVLNLAFAPHPANDDFANRIALGSGNARATGSSFGATAESGETLVFSWLANGTLWWSWTAAETGPVRFQVSGAPPTAGDHWFWNDFRIASLSIFVGDQLESLTLVTNWFGVAEIGSPISEVVVEAVAGTTYQVAVGGVPGYLGRFDLATAKTAPPGAILTTPRNGAEFKAGTPIEVAAEAVDPEGSLASVEFIAHAWSHQNDAGLADSVRPFRVVLSNLPPATYSLIARAQDGAGIKADSIPIEFNVRPINDAFADRIPLTGAFVTATGTLANATIETNGSPERGRGDIWWEWTAPASGTFTMTATAEFGRLDLGVFIGAVPGSLTPVARETGSTSDRAVVQVKAGIHYAIAIASSSYLDACALHIAQTAPPSIRLISPTNQTRIVKGTVFSLSAEAADPDGSISRVEFFSGFDDLLGVVTNAPFTLSLLLTSGWRNIHAVATDNQGICTRSDDAFLEVIPAPPPNDDFANRFPLTGSFVTVTGVSAYATFEPGEDSVLQYGSVWWEWTAPESGDFSIMVEAAPGYSPLCAVYTGLEVGYLTLVTNTALGWFFPTHTALVTLRAVAGEQYQIAADGWWGPARLSVLRTLPPTISITEPAFDTVIYAGEPVTVRAEAADPDGSISRVEFYSFGSIPLAVLTNEPFEVSILLHGGGLYLVEAVAFDNYGIPGRSGASIRVQAVREPGPANDAFADRIHFTGSFVSVTGSTANATSESGEYFWNWNGEGYCTPSGPAWWEWTAPESGTFTIAAQGKAGSWLALAVLTGVELGELELITNDAYCGNALEDSIQVVFEAQAGVAYPIAAATSGDILLSVARTTPPVATILYPTTGAVVRKGAVVLRAGVSDAEGTIRRVEFYSNGALLGVATNEPFVLQTTFEELAYHQLRIRATDDRGVSALSDEVSFMVRDRPPANDDFVNRTMLHGWFVTLEATDSEATREPGEPTPDGSTGSIWWSWTAPASGRATLTTPGGYLAVCAGTNVAELSVIAARQAGSPGSQLEFDAVAGANYEIVFQSIGGAVGTFRMSLLLDARELRNPRMLASGRFAFDLLTTLERTWILEATTNLVDWAPVAPGRHADGTIEFQDPSAASHPRRFYRVVAE